MSENKNKYIGFMAHLSISEFDYLEEIIQEYDCGYYLIGYEAEPYNHFHFVCQMSLPSYHNFTKRVFITKYKLRGKASAGKARQYGKIKNIDDIEKLKSYTIKDGNYRSNMSEADVKSIFEKSHKKESIKLLKEKVYDYIESNKGFTNYLIVKYCIENEVDISPSKLKMLRNYWLQRTDKITLDEKISQIQILNNFL